MAVDGQSGGKTKGRKDRANADAIAAVAQNNGQLETDELEIIISPPPNPQGK